MSKKMSKSKQKDYRRDWLKERRQRTYWEKRCKELEATIKDDNKDLKMSEAYDKAMGDLHEAHDKLVAELKECKAALKKCQEECHRKDAEIARLEEGGQLAPGPPQDADENVDNTAQSGFSDEKVTPLSAHVPAPTNNPLELPERAESKDDTSSDGTSSGTSDDEEEETMPVEPVDLLKKLRF